MIKITTFLSQQEYICMIRNYLLSRGAYRILSSILFCIVIYASISTLLGSISFNAMALLVWWSLTAIYTLLIPIIITFRAKLIYQNTKFFHHTMTFTINEHSILWATSAGSKEIPFSKIYKIETTKYALILSLSPYQVLAIPYKDITQEAWDYIKLYSKVLQKHAKINDHYYQKYQTRISNV